MSNTAGFLETDTHIEMKGFQRRGVIVSLTLIAADVESQLQRPTVNIKGTQG